MGNKTNEERDNMLLFKAFQENLVKPTINQIAFKMFLDKQYNEIQLENNISLLVDMEVAVFDYVSRANLMSKKFYDFDFSTTENTCDCNYNCECHLNQSVARAFMSLIERFNIDVETDPVLSVVLDKYTKEEQDRLELIAGNIYRVLLYRELACWAHYIGFYQVACMYHDAALLMYGGADSHAYFENPSYIKDIISSRNQKASDARWQPHREEKLVRKKRYLKIMKDKGFSTYNDAATYIKLHVDTGKSPSFNTVCRLLSEADKGNFS